MSRIVAACSIVLSCILFIGCSKPTPTESLIDAASNGDVKSVVGLIKGVPFDATDEDGETSLHWATSGCHMDVVQQLIDLGANVNYVDHAGRTPLMVTATALRGKGYSADTMPIRNQIAALLIKHGADVNRADEGGRTALHCAVGDRNPDLIRMLLAAGADKSTKDSQGYTPLYLARSWGYDQAAAALEGK